jgi:hypothetical protein
MITLVAQLRVCYTSLSHTHDGTPPPPPPTRNKLTRTHAYPRAVNLYSSTDLVAWTAHGNVLPLSERPNETSLFSPRAIYNAKTQMWVLWFNYVPRYRCVLNVFFCLSVCCLFVMDLLRAAVQVCLECDALVAHPRIRLQMLLC